MSEEVECPICYHLTEHEFSGDSGTVECNNCGSEFCYEIVQTVLVRKPPR